MRVERKGARIARLRSRNTALAVAVIGVLMLGSAVRPARSGAVAGVSRCEQLVPGRLVQLRSADHDLCVVQPGAYFLTGRSDRGIQLRVETSGDVAVTLVSATLRTVDRPVITVKRASTLEIQLNGINRLGAHVAPGSAAVDVDAPLALAGTGRLVIYAPGAIGVRARSFTMPSSSLRVTGATVGLRVTDQVAVSGGDVVVEARSVGVSAARFVVDGGDVDVQSRSAAAIEADLLLITGGSVRVRGALGFMKRSGRGAVEITGGELVLDAARTGISCAVLRRAADGADVVVRGIEIDSESLVAPELCR